MKVKLVLIHQHDPTIPHVGGVGTFIDTFIRNAPHEFDIYLLGVVAHPEHHPVGQWHKISIGQKEFNFFPLVASNPVHVPWFPLSIRILWAIFRYRKQLEFSDAILEFHRIEQMLAVLRHDNAKVLFLHGHHMKDFYNKKTEVRWGRMPGVYFWLERRLLPQAKRIYIVREDAVGDYKNAYPSRADDISFLPTWVDESVFRSLSESERSDLHQQFVTTHNLPATAKLLLFVGRFEGQKDPLRLLGAFKLVKEALPDIALILIGEGSLKADMQHFIAENNLSSAVRFLPPMSQEEVGLWMNASDALCLSSAFEGMPRAVVEALHCGLPVISTAVGEAWRLIGDNQGGRLVVNEGVEEFAKQMIDLLEGPPSHESCQQQVASFTATKILTPVYQYYRDLTEAEK